MRIVADFHIHSPYARAVSKEMTLENLEFWARIKGITVMGTGDFTHPQWIKEIKNKLEPAEPGLYKIKKQKYAFDTGQAKIKNSKIRFIPTVEISSIYSKGGKTRRVHNLIIVSSIEAAEKINIALGKQGNLKSDGRPIVGVGSKELLKMALDADPDCLFVPAHAWTPWFSVFGSKSGFDTVEECFDEYAKYIYALETGLSSDPIMNWRVSALDKYALLSNSDSHSLRRIGREANVFDTELSYFALRDAIKKKDKKKFISTIEFYPEEGMYHYDGHRSCGVKLHPDETKKLGNKCPVCKRGLTIGVMNRVEQIADRPEGFIPQNAIPYKNMVPLDEIIAESLGIASPLSKKVIMEYETLIRIFGTELAILFDIPLDELNNASIKPKIINGIHRVREGRLSIEPGYDGEYGRVKIFAKAN